MSLDLLLENCRYKKEIQKIASIDVGITNMGFVFVEIEGKNISKILRCELVNIKEITNDCCNPHCNLGHSNDVIDWVQHFIHKFKIELESATYILIEKQPPGGLQHVEVLLVKEYRSKVKQIYPVSLHSWMLVSKKSYDDRKKEMIKRASPFLSDMKYWKLNKDRQHDMADALCFVLYYLENCKREECYEYILPESSFIIREIESFKYCE